MNLGIISDEIKDVNRLASHFLKYFDISIHDRTKSKKIKLVGNKKIAIYHQLHSFYKSSDLVLFGFKERDKVFHFINQWGNFHEYGTIMLVHFYEIGFAEKVKKCLSHKNKDIEVVYYPFAPNTFLGFNNTYDILGGNINDSFFKRLRTKMAENKPLFITTPLEAELISLAFRQMRLLEKAFIIEMSQLSEEWKVNSDIVERFITHLWKCNMINYPELYHHIIQHQLSENHNQKQKMITIAKNVIEEDDRWAVREIRNLLATQQIHTVTILGEVTEEFIKQMKDLKIRSIKVYPKKKVAYHEQNIYFYDHLYLAVKEADVVIILSRNNEIESLSITKLTSLVKQRIMLDKIKLFEVEEIEAYDWSYISKGRRIE